MITATVQFIAGRNGAVLRTTTLDLDAAVIGGASGPYGSRHLLQLGRHFDHYYDRGRVLPIWQTRGIYSRLPNFNKDLKSHANDVVGQIGECSGALIMRRLVGLSTSEIEPLVVDANRKTPDFRVNLQPSALQQIGLPQLPVPLPTEWPLESKSRPSHSDSRDGFYEALQQIATYWLLRSPQEPSVVGYGLIAVAFGNLSQINMHVVIPMQPSGIQGIQAIINDFHSQEYSKKRLTQFQKKFADGSYEVRNFLQDCQES
jgi:hypothetical protein